MSTVKQAASKKRQAKLETANEMFKMAFLVKKHKFSQADPQLSESELQKKTAAYFRNLPKD